ncbi:unnamed protein product, partial [Ilex paraguariensis]
MEALLLVVLSGERRLVMEQDVTMVESLKLKGEKDVKERILLGESKDCGKGCRTGHRMYYEEI